MKWSWKLGHIAGIGVFLHWTFLLLIAWIFISYLAQGESVLAALVGVGFILALFGCILLHELGHALTARRYGVSTKDIILLPIGGVARLQKMPEQPLHELAVAAAGPAVNVVIAALLAVALYFVVGPEQMLVGGLAEGSNFFQNLMWVNVVLVVFNLIPAFPMDGGRMLRAVLAMQMPYERATNIAASVGQALAILFAIVGLFLNPFLLFIALFVYLGATGEAQLTEVRMLLRDVPVTAAMITNFRTVTPNDTLKAVVNELLDGSQMDFPVIEEGVFRGMIRRRDLAQALQEQGPETLVAEVMQPDCPTLTHRDMLEGVMEQIQTGQCSTLPVFRDDHLIGLVTTENLGELMMIRAAMRGEDSRQAERFMRVAS